MIKYLRLFLAIIFVLGIAGIARAQTTSVPAVPCILTTTGCSGGQHSCCIPISSTNPMPIQ